jgi:acetylglutamate kinase
LTDVPGILDDRGEVISNISLDEGKSLVNDRIIGGGMIPKLESSIKCIESGIEKVHIIDGSKPHALLLELFTDRGVGTMIFR